MDDTAIPDHRLALMFACAHPAIDPAIRAPLMLQTILGFDAAAIASAFLVAPATMGQRLVRAKAKIRQAGIPLRVPERAEMPERLDAVLAAIYAAFAGGWLDAARRNLAEEALWLGRLVASLLPDEPEALGLLALMLHAEARRARATRRGRAPTCRSTSRTRRCGTCAMIEEAEALLLRASADGGDRALSARGGGAVGACGAPADRAIRLGRRSSGSTMRCRRSPTHRWWRSTTPIADRRDARGGSGTGRVSTHSRSTRGWRTTSPTGRRVPNCWRAPARPMRPIRPTSVPSVWRPIRRCATSCSRRRLSVASR